VNKKEKLHSLPLKR